MKFIKSFLVFVILNFTALFIGSWLMAQGPQNRWYIDLNKAPWTPDGWVFGVAWTIVMICFSAYMAYLYPERPTNKIALLFAIQFILNISWNFIFFDQRLINIALVNIVVLAIIITAFLFTYLKDLKGKSILILPYLIWLCVATSLNLYISIYN
ncbi:TspO/MBR family protein [uncultured Psychroserpens sp.]|uniref:TspO/MBR family protein n=1 Tax=uncultured Psychroserpens sp. TaxID=255436 RepID=UPI0026308DF9|nr:TspO/MBR family protein [uncultured Psychroserpens sp.]